MAKIKTNNSKKDTEVYDLSLLECELDKIVPLCKSEENREISIADVREFCVFDQVLDIWAFIKNTVNGDYKPSIELLNGMLDQQGSSSILWLLNSQIAFLIQLKEYRHRGIRDYLELQKLMGENNHFGKYLNNHWEEMEPSSQLPAINPWRIRKACESIDGWDISILTRQHNAVANAIIDLRSGGSEDIVMPYLVLSLCGIVNYDNCLYHY
jgi:hypothetical protein